MRARLQVRILSPVPFRVFGMALFFTPFQLRLGRRAAKPSYPSPIEGEGFEGRLVLLPVRHSRAGGKPASGFGALDSRLRGNDDGVGCADGLRGWPFTVVRMVRFLATEGTGVPAASSLRA